MSNIESAEVTQNQVEMDQIELDDASVNCEFFTQAEAFYKFLGSLYYLELTEEQITALSQQGFAYPDDGSEMGDACKEARRYLKRRGSNSRQDLAVDYARIFLAAGVYDGDTAVPFESVYTSDEGILMQDSRDSVVKIYGQNGLCVPTSLNVPEDHLAFELEFMSHMSSRIAEAIQAEDETAAKAKALMQTQLAFIDEHLLNWLPALMERIDSYAKLAFYPAVAKITKCFIEENRAVLVELLGEAAAPAAASAVALAAEAEIKEA